MVEVDPKYTPEKMMNLLLNKPIQIFMDPTEMAQLKLLVDHLSDILEAYYASQAAVALGKGDELTDYSMMKRAVLATAIETGVYATNIVRIHMESENEPGPECEQQALGKNT